MNSQPIRLFLCALCALLFQFFPCARSFAADARPPNIVFILADDLGAHDLGFAGSKFHETPHLDALAKRGLRFTQAYAANPLCSPTRASILTGLWPARLGITSPACHLPEEIFEQTLQARAAPDRKCLVANSVTRLKHDYATLAEVLKEAGYRTGHFGKWHLGREPYDPLHHGFEVDFPHWPGPGPAGSYVAPWRFPDDLKVAGQPGEHIEDRVAGEVVKFIREHKDQPFYVNYFCFSVHAPFDAKDELVAKYRRKIDPASPQRNPVYAAMVESLDAAVGRVVATIDEFGLAERTIIVFFSDNGGISWDIDAGRSARFEADFKSPPTSNLPLRGGKANIYEGGVREPCLVVWPGHVAGGGQSDALVQSIDFFPTLLELAGLTPTRPLALDGISFAPVLRGQPGKRETVLCHFPHQTPASGQIPASSIRRGDWKLIRCYADNLDQTDRFELYNLKEDPGESRDRSAAEPDKVKQLAADLAAWLADTKAVLPRANPAFDPADRPAPMAAKKEEKGQVKQKLWELLAMRPLLALWAVLMLAAVAAGQTRPPNIVFILADDLGYGDLGCYGHPTIRTPHLDRMAREGMRFTQFYSAAEVCTPSRAALLTGRLPPRSGMCSNKRRVAFPNTTGGLPDSELTLAELLKTKGYATACFGKWHLGHLPAYSPQKHGFDEYFGLPYSNDMDRVAAAPMGRAAFLDPKIEYWNVPLLKNGEVIERPADQHTLSRRYTDEAVRFIREHKDGPFFVYLPHTMPHVPLFASEEFAGKSPRKLYGDVVEELDANVGRLLQMLRDEKLAERTLVIFSSDNGPWLTQGDQGGSAGLLKDGKGSTWEGGMRVPGLAWQPGWIPAGSVSRELASTLDILPTALALAGADLPKDRPLDGYDISPALAGGKSPRQEMFYYRGFELMAARLGPWKAQFQTQTGYGQPMAEKHDPPLLYNLEVDPSERFNVAAANADRLKAIEALVAKHQAGMHPAPSQLE